MTAAPFALAPLDTAPKRGGRVAQSAHTSPFWAVLYAWGEWRGGSCHATIAAARRAAIALAGIHRGGVAQVWQMGRDGTAIVVWSAATAIATADELNAAQAKKRGILPRKK